jgi:hypothetical protein
MFSDQSSSWIPLLVVPFGVILYVAVLLGVLWVATRVVRHAWYWRSSPAPEPATGDQDLESGRS